MIKTLHFFALLFTAVAMAAGWAHLLALPNKIGLPAAAYLTVQQIYRGWALLGWVVVGALLLAAALAVLLRGAGPPFYFALAAALCLALSLALFFAFTFPANRATQDWSFLPPGWEGLRRQWEYSHAAGALLNFLALACLALGALFGRR